MNNHPTKAKLGSCTAIVTSWMVTAAFLINGQVLLGQTNWTNTGGGNWSNAANWSAGVPVAGSTAQFLAAGTYGITLDIDSTFSTMSASGAGINISFAASATPRILTLTSNFQATNGAIMTFNAPAATITATGAMTINNGGTIMINGGTSLTTGQWNIGNTAGAAAGLLLDGTGTLYTGSGTGTLFRVGSGSGTSGFVSVRNNATMDLDNSASNVLRIAGNTSNTTGTVNVETGGILNAANITVGAPAVGTFTNCNGTLNLSGTSSQISQAGAATLNIGAFTNNNIGQFNISSGTFNSGTGQTVLFPGSTIALSGGTYNANGNVQIFGTVSHSGGQFNLASGRTLELNGSGIWNGTGSASLSMGTSSILTLVIGNTLGTPALNVGSSATVSASSNSTINATQMAVGTNATVNIGIGTAAALNVSGPTETVFAAGSSLSLSNNSSGTFAGGITLVQGTTTTSAIVQSGADITSLGNTRIANTATTGNASFTVTGSGSTVVQSTGSGLTVGAASGSTGSLTVSSNGSFTSGGGLSTIDKTGTVTVTSGGTFVQNGTLNVKGNFNVAAGSAYGLQGSIAVSSAGSFVNNNAMSLGDTQSVSVAGTGSLFEASSLALETGSNLTINGGTARSNFAFNGGSVAFSAGTLHHTSSLAADSSVVSSILGPTATLGTGKSLVVDGTTTVTSGMTIDGGRLSTGNLIGGNLLSLNKGTVQISGSTLTVGAAGPFGNLLPVNNGLTVETINAQSSTVASDGRLVVNGGVFGSAGSLTNNGEIQLISNLSTVRGGNLVNNSMLVGTGRIENNLQNNALGVIQANGSERLVFSGTTNTNVGNINATSSGRIEFRSALTNNSGGLITSQGANLRFDGGLTNNGALGISSGASNVFGDVTNNASGVINVSGGGQATFSEDMVQNGTMQIVRVGNTTSSAVIFGSFSGSGGFTGGGDLFAMGDLRPGNSPASVTFGGNLFMGASTHTFIELGGMSTGQFDQMMVLGDLTLNGSLAVSLIGSHRLALNQRYRIAEVSGNLFGQFNGLGEGARIGNFGEFDLFISYQSGTGNDITLFTQPAFKNGIPYLTGGSGQGGDVHSAVPEPSGSMLLLVTVLGFVGPRKKKHWDAR